MYTTVLFLHILSAIVWVGSGFYGQLASQQILTRDGPLEVDRIMDRFERVNNWVFIPFPLLTIATGIAMVVMSQGVRFSDLWIVIALVVIVAEMALVAPIRERSTKKLKSLRQEGLVGTDEHSQTLNRLLGVGWVGLVMYLVILGVMVFKPVI